MIFLYAIYFVQAKDICWIKEELKLGSMILKDINSMKDNYKYII